MNDIFFTMPVAFVAAPALFFLTILFISTIFGFLGSIDIDVNGDGISDINLNPISKVMISSGISRVPFIVGITLTYWVALPIVYLTDSFLFEPFLGGLAHQIVCVFYSIAILYLSLYIAGFLLKPLAILISQNDSFVMPSLIGLDGVANSTVSDGFGRVTIDYKDKSTMINARVSEGSEVIPSGSRITVLSLLKEENSDSEAIYLVDVNDST